MPRSELLLAQGADGGAEERFPSNKYNKADGYVQIRGFEHSITRCATLNHSTHPNAGTHCVARSASHAICPGNNSCFTWAWTVWRRTPLSNQRTGHGACRSHHFCGRRKYCVFCRRRCGQCTCRIPPIPRCRSRSVHTICAHTASTDTRTVDCKSLCDHR